MNDKLNKLIRNFLVSLAIGAIVFGSIGYYFKTEKYYYYSMNDTGYQEVTKFFFDYLSEKKDPNDLKQIRKTDVYNYDFAITTGFVSYGLCFLLLTGIGAIKVCISKFKNER